MKTRIRTIALLRFLPGLFTFAESGAPSPPEAPPITLENIQQRLGHLIADSAAAQFKATGNLPADRSFTVGQYPALVDFLYGWPGNLQPLLGDVLDASGSSIIGMWFLSQAHRILEEVNLFDTSPLRQALRLQLERAAHLPQFFQGTTQDVWGCPPETMGWYPLVDGHRLPALIPDGLEDQFPDATRKDLANLSDGDIWAWFMAVDETTPGILQYHHPITAKDIYAPLLGSRQAWQSIHEQSRLLYLRVRGTPVNPRFPIGTFYNTSTERKQRFSCVVNANILASIPLLQELPQAYQEDIANATEFVRDATYMAILNRLTWWEFAYDYYTISVAPIAYVARAHKRIVEIGRVGYPRLIDERTIKAAVGYVSRQARRRLANTNLYSVEGAQDYASLVYCFNTMMNLRHTDPSLFDQALVDQTARALLRPNPASYTVPGTGPYLVVAPIWADMASICFVAPPLIEAFALYLQLEG